MENGGKTEECLEMAVIMEGIHTHVADEIGWRVSAMDCIC